jgi:hypothetical protein
MTALSTVDTAVPVRPALAQDAATATEVERLAALERRLLRVIPWIVFGGVILLTLGAGTLSWSHLTHIAATNGHIASRWLLFVFPSIVDGFMILSSGVVVWHAITDEVTWRTWYAGGLVAGTATLTICLNIQDATGYTVVPGWLLPGIAPALYLLSTELGLNELRLLMRRLRARIRATSAGFESASPPPPMKRDVVLAVLRETGWHVPTALRVLDERGVEVDRSYVYEIKRGQVVETSALTVAEVGTGDIVSERDRPPA